MAGACGAHYPVPEPGCVWCTRVVAPVTEVHHWTAEQAEQAKALADQMKRDEEQRCPVCEAPGTGPEDCKECAGD